jgi:hypothetical protein
LLVRKRSLRHLIQIKNSIVLAHSLVRKVGGHDCPRAQILVLMLLPDVTLVLILNRAVTQELVELGECR